MSTKRFLHERNRGRRDCDGRPDREPAEIERWAQERGLPCDDGHVRFPDVRVEYEDIDAGRGLVGGRGGSRRTSHPRLAEELL